MTIGGIVCTRNTTDLDYCWRESIQSLLPVCDMVTVCDGESADGTQEEIRQWMLREPKIVLCVYPWPNPKGDASFWVDWLQYARQHTPTDMVLQLDADEVLSEKSAPIIESFRTNQGRFSARCHRYNFWRDHRHLIPHGHCCSHRVIRLCPANIFLPSDGPDPRGAEATNMAVDSDIEIFHYGFIRERKAWFKKARTIMSYFFDTYDKRLEEAEQREGNWMESPGVTGWETSLLDYTGHHPLVAHNWLKGHGYEP